MTNFAKTERLALAAELRTTGPDAPTLCEGWDTRELAHHIIIRDRYPLSLPGNAFPQFADRLPWLGERAKKTSEQLAQRDWSEIVGMVASGPGMLSPMSLDAIDHLANTAEFFIHHEDVRRAARGWAPRNMPHEFEQQCWRMLGTILRPSGKHANESTEYVADGFGSVRVGPRTGEVKVIAGKPSEILMYVFGREEHAHVDIRAGKSPSTEA